MGKEIILKNKNKMNKMNTNESLDQTMDRSRDNNIVEANYKTEMCRTWIEKNFCPYKEKCKFAHGKKDMHDKIVNTKNYKMKECKSFFQKGYCPYGPRCNFKHDQRKIEEIDRTYYQNLLSSKQTLANFLNNLEECENSQEVLFNFYPVYNNGCTKKRLPILQETTDKTFFHLGNFERFCSDLEKGRKLFPLSCKNQTNLFIDCPKNNFVISKRIFL
jgi:hypothetical protein